MTSEKPQFLVAAEEVAKVRGVRPEEILEEDRERALTADYPGPECLEPWEVEAFLEGTPTALLGEIEEHVSSCSACLALLCSASSSKEELEGLLALVRKMRSETHEAEERKHVTSLSYAVDRG